MFELSAVIVMRHVSFVSFSAYAVTPRAIPGKVSAGKYDIAPAATTNAVIPHSARLSTVFKSLPPYLRLPFSDRLSSKCSFLPCHKTQQEYYKWIIHQIADFINSFLPTWNKSVIEFDIE